MATALRKDGRSYTYRIVGTKVVDKPRSIVDAEISGGNLIIYFSDGTQDNTGIVGTTLASTLPQNAVVSRITGQLLLSPVTGDQLVGGVQP